MTGAASNVHPRAGLLIDALEPSPDGTQVAFMDPTEGLEILDLATGAVRPVRLETRVAAPPLRWSDDGGSLFMMTVETAQHPALPTTLAALELATGHLTVLATDALTYDLR